MPRHAISTARCQICGLDKPISAMVPVELVRPEVGRVIREHAANLDPAGYICLTDLGLYRREYLSKLLQEELGELSTLDKEVLESMHQRDLLSSNVTEEFDRQATFGERLADRIADFGG